MSSSITRTIGYKQNTLRFVRSIFGNTIIDFSLFVAANRYIPSVSNPKSFNEKIFHIKRKVKDLRVVSLCDKVLVRDYVKNKIGEQYLIPVLLVAKELKDVNFEQIGNSFVMKPTNASGLYHINRDENPNVAKLSNIFKSWANLNYSRIGGEWQYRKGNQQVMFEKLLVDNDGMLARDYKIHCFRDAQGNFKQIVEIHSDRFGSHVQVFFDENLKQVKIEKKSKFAEYNLDENIPLIEMMKLSRKLSVGFNYVRVDWYFSNGNIYFGEMTFTSGNGISSFKNKSHDFELGKLF